VIISRSTNTGVVIARNPKMGGMDVIIVGLNKEFESGADFALDDIGWVKKTLHFGDREAMQNMIKMLERALEKWEDE
jgi:hypothetical protein